MAVDSNVGPHITAAAAAAVVVVMTKSIPYTPEKVTSRGRRAAVNVMSPLCRHRRRREQFQEAARLTFAFSSARWWRRGSGVGRRGGGEGG